MAFFRQFPKVDYDFNRVGTTQQMTDIFRHVKPLPAFIDNITAYKFYEIKNGERPDIVSNRLYGTPSFYWTFFVVNDHLHDGYRSWPMSAEQLFDYMAKEYNGYAITTDTIIRRNSDQIITDHENSLAGRFKLGEEIVGLTSGARGTLKHKNVDMNQLIVQDVTVAAFQGDPKAVPNVTEKVKGQTTEDFVNTYEVFAYADAPYYYYDESDGDKKPVTNARFIAGGVSDSNLSYVSNRTHEFELNEERSKIRYVDPNYIGEFVNKFKKLINA